MKMRGLHIILVALISALLGYYIGITKVDVEWKQFRPSVNFINRQPPASVRQKVDFSQMWAVLSKLETSYYDKSALDTQKLLNGAISGMVQSLGDPYTVYLPPVQNKDFKQGLAGEKFEGIGAELGMNGKQLIVVAPLEGNPAKKAGILPGDAILKVDGQPTAGWTLAQAVDKIRGPRGTAVILTVVHKESNKPVDVKITRETIHVKSVVGWMKKVSQIDQISKKNLPDTSKDKNIIYIRVSQFGDQTNQEWLSQINSLVVEKNKKDNLSGVILDLRNNPGGYLTDATFIASEFIKDGVVVKQEKGNGEETDFSVVRKGLLTDVPVVVLINKGSASASEIVAGALRDHGRAKLVGETSFGKGTIQQAEDLGAGAGIHVTIAKWLTPDGTWVHGKGLTPDVAVNLDEKDQTHDKQLEKAVEVLLQ